MADRVSEKIMSLISSMSKRHNASGSDNDGSAVAKEGKKVRKKVDMQECLVAECTEVTAYPLFPLHYHTLVSAKSPSLKLRNGYGDATFDTATSLIVYPPKMPAHRLPSNVKKVTTLAAGSQWLAQPISCLYILDEIITFYVDSGAGQSMRSSSETFHVHVLCWWLELRGICLYIGMEHVLEKSK
jgi:hypothetical protein